MKLFSRLCSLGLALVFSSITHAAVIVTIEEVGSDVLVSTSGTLDLTGMTIDGGGSLPSPFIQSSNGIVVLGDGAANYYDGDIISGPSNFGTGSSLVPGSTSSDAFGIDMSGNRLYLSSSWGAGSIAANATFSGASFASLGLTPGSYVYTLSSSDTITINVVPEPSQLGLFVGLAALSLLVRRRRR